MERRFFPLCSHVASALIYAAALAFTVNTAFAGDINRDNVGLTGSFIMAAICKDGIIIGSDSRGTFYEVTDKDTRKPIAYIDGIQKIFPVGSNAIAATGNAVFSGLFFSALIDEFKKTEYAKVPVDRLLGAFQISFVSRTYVRQIYDQLVKQKMIAVGYLGSEPRICYADANQLDEGKPPVLCLKDGLFESHETPTSGAQFLSLSAKEASEVMEKAITEYAGKDDRWKTMGGPISILLITESAVSWLKNEPPVQQWTVFNDLRRDYLDNKVEIKLIPPTSAEELKKFFE